MDRRRASHDVPARRGSHAAPSRPRWARRILAGVGVLVLLIGGGTVVAATVLKRNITTVDLTPALGTDRPSAAPIDPDGGRAVNFLVMGSDSRAGDNGFVGGAIDAPKSDTTLLVHLAADRSRAVAVSIPRDSLVDVPSCTDPVTRQTTPGSRRMFNNAFETGGPACTLRTVESLTGIRIDHWVVVEFNGFKNVVDALGTVPICLAQPVNDDQHNIHLPAGRSEVDGETALKYVRERYEIGDGSDLGRIDRQQAFIASVLQKATSTGTLSNPAKTYAVLRAVTGALTMNPELSSLTRLAGFAQAIQHVGLKKIRFLTVPTGPAPDDVNRLVWTDQAEQVWTALREDRPLETAADRDTDQDGTPSPTRSPSRGATPGTSSGASASPSPSGVVLDGVKVRSADADICPS
ncbi:MAG: LCP family protein [Kineosporiaceae bacterium]|nr:LCP family protein [Kineosporiaceae bacterium]